MTHHDRELTEKQTRGDADHGPSAGIANVVEGPIGSASLVDPARKPDGGADRAVSPRVPKPDPQVPGTQDDTAE